MVLALMVKAEAGRHEGPRRPSCGRLRFVPVLLRLEVTFGRMEGRGRNDEIFLSELSHGDGGGEAHFMLLHATLRVEMSSVMMQEPIEI